MSRFFIEAESFENLGGWVVDQQSMEVMGSSYIMAHGMGNPVADASQKITLAESGTWHAWVRTRDWTAVWKRGTPAGRFLLKADGVAFKNTLGTNGEKWDWQYAGSMDIKQRQITLSLCDLTGFNGRCDAIYMSTSVSDVPVNNEEFRNAVSGNTVTDVEDKFDLVVCGGGIAGTCMALTAIQKGLRVALIQDRPVLGGCNSSEIKVGLGGFSHALPYKNIGNVLDWISPIFGSPGTYDDSVYEDDRKRNAFLISKVWGQKDYVLSLNEHVVALENDGEKIISVTTKNIYTGNKKRYFADLFADCTGDAVLARMAGADVMYGREAESEYGENLAPDTADNMVMGMTVTWNSALTDNDCPFPDIDWGIEFDEEHCYHITFGDWEWEAGQFRDMALETEYIRDYSLMTIFGNWSFLKNRSKDREFYKKRRLNWISPLGGKRESYRVVGDKVLTQNDIINQVNYDDGTASLTWDIDIHYPDPDNLEKFKEPFRSCAIHRGIKKHYPVPYRCLYSKDIENLFLGGRIISTTHIAFACVRVMRTLGCLGEVCGFAAAVCKDNNCTPRQVYTEHFDELKELMEKGVEISPYHAYGPGDGENLHFPGCNKFITSSHDTALPLDDKEMMRRINNMGVRYATYDKFKDIENHTELTDEEKGICERFYKLIGTKNLKNLLY